MKHDELTKTDNWKEIPLERAAITMAVAVVFKRLTELPAEDIQDLYGLAKELPRAKNEEDLEAIRVAMVEILDQEKGEIRPLEPCETPDKLQKWIDFIANKIRTFRKVAGLTQVQLAEKSGLPQSHISRIESARLSPSRATLEKLASAFGKSVGDLDPAAQ